MGLETDSPLLRIGTKMYEGRCVTPLARAPIIQLRTLRVVAACDHPRSEHSIWPALAALVSLSCRFEYVIGTHLFFSPNASPVGTAGSGARGVAGYSYHGKASKKIVFRPVVLTAKT